MATTPTPSTGVETKGPKPWVNLTPGIEVKRYDVSETYKNATRREIVTILNESDSLPEAAPDWDLQNDDIHYEILDQGGVSVGRQGRYPPPPAGQGNQEASDILGSYQYIVKLLRDVLHQPEAAAAVENYLPPILYIETVKKRRQ